MEIDAIYAGLPMRACLEEACPGPEGWRAMVYAPRDGTSVELLIEHRTWWTAHKCSPDEARMWRAICAGQWIDHNGGGWTWAGMSGTPIGWRVLKTPNVGGEARLAAHQPSQTTTATPQGVASTDQLGARRRSEET